MKPGYGDDPNYSDHIIPVNWTGTASVGEFDLPEFLRPFIPGPGEIPPLLIVRVPRGSKAERT
ncbi:MAG: hypothetical protein ACREXY_13105 [Gammaproteobacteria bacterium]